MTALPVALSANGLEGRSTGRSVDNTEPQGFTYHRGNSVQTKETGSCPAGC